MLFYNNKRINQENKWNINHENTAHALQLANKNIYKQMFYLDIKHRCIFIQSIHCSLTIIRNLSDLLQNQCKHFLVGHFFRVSVMRQKRVQRTYCKQCTPPSMSITLIETVQQTCKDTVLKQQETI